ncbi:MAG: hypothetical protein N2Z72_08155 [Bacteroidales bacterium]|nr:hypothetical protein [Bacteroidales bacterium]
MISFFVPGRGKFDIEHVVMDYNGTLAKDGRMYPGLKELLYQLSKLVSLHVITADTFGLAASELQNCPVKLVLLSDEVNQQEQKLKYIHELGADHCVAIGNGANDVLMLKEAELSLALVQEEGVFVEAIQVADVIFRSITEALNALIEPRRLIATLRK